MACSIAAQKLRTGGAGTPEDWARCLYEADQALVRSGGQCTAVVVEISEGRLVGASVGDSGAWLLTGKAIIDLTENQHRKPLLGSDEAMPCPGSLHSAKKASPAATHSSSEKNVMNSFTSRSHRGTPATFSTSLRPNSCRRRSTSALLNPVTALFRLATASSADSWWILTDMSMCGTVLYSRCNAIVSLRPGALSMRWYNPLICPSD
jgi:hypothetical protein